MNNEIFIVDDHRLFAQSLQVLVDSYEGFEVKKLFKNGEELVIYMEDENPVPDIILLDMRMPVMDGIETMEWLKENRPELKVLALTVDQEEETIIRMLKLGCRGYLLKDIDPEEFEHALNTIVKKGYYSNKTISEALNHEEENKYETLTTREIKFIRNACSEMTYKAIAEEMNLSPKTIDGYRESIFSKLRLKSRVGLVLFAIKEGIYKIN